MRAFVNMTMDRPIDRNLHYISPGGYGFEFSNGKCVAFDFLESSAEINGNKISFELRSLDLAAFPEASELDEMLRSYEISSINEFYVFTGEFDDFEINVTSIDSMIFELDDYTLIEVSHSLLKKF